MRLILKKYPNGRLRPRWYGVYEYMGKTNVVSLCRFKGHPPASQKVNDHGDELFEASRQQASRDLREVVGRHRSEADRENLVQQIHEARYGVKVATTGLAAMATRWEQLPRKRKYGEKHAEKCRLIFSRFQQFLAGQAPEIQEMGAVTGDQMRAFMEAEEARGVSSGTWNETLALLKGIYRRFEPYSDAWRTYLAKQPAKDRDVIHREPFKPEELDAILAAASTEPLMRALIVTALCTAMRRGDVCRLRWREVDLQQGFITVKTSKTGATVDIPIFPMLLAELEQARAGRNPQPDDFVFPEAAELFATNAHGLNWRLKGVLERAGFVDPKKIKQLKEAQAARAQQEHLSPEDVLRRGLEAIEGESMSARRCARMKEILSRYLRGDSVKKIAAELPVSVGTVSGHLAEVERLTGAAVVRRPELPAVIRGATLAETPEGMVRKNRAALRGWHSFRTTWITLALSAGVSEMIVRRVTGHATVDVVMKYYFRPGRAQFRATLSGVLPNALTGGVLPDKAAEVLQIVRAMTPETCVRDQARLLELLVPQETHG